MRRGSTFSSARDITQRKPIPYKGRNSTTLDSDYSSEEAKYTSLKAKRELVEEQRRVSLFGSSEEKLKLKRRINSEADIQIQLKNQRVAQERRQEMEDVNRVESYRVRMQDLEYEREYLRRERMKQIQEENRLASIAKRMDNAERKNQQDRQDREAILNNITRFRPNVF